MKSNLDVETSGLCVIYLGAVGVWVGAVSQQGFHDFQAIVLHRQAQRAVSMLQGVQSGRTDST
jgi:hypothetical protein